MPQPLRCQNPFKCKKPTLCQNKVGFVVFAAKISVLTLNCVNFHKLPYNAPNYVNCREAAQLWVRIKNLHLTKLDQPLIMAQHHNNSGRVGILIKQKPAPVMTLGGQLSYVKLTASVVVSCTEFVDGVLNRLISAGSTSNIVIFIGLPTGWLCVSLVASVGVLALQLLRHNRGHKSRCLHFPGYRSLG